MKTDNDISTLRERLRYCGRKLVYGANLEYAKKFDPDLLASHYRKHGQAVKARSETDYASRAIYFANHIHYTNHAIISDRHGINHKYSYRTGEYVAVTHRGIVLTYLKIAYEDFIRLGNKIADDYFDLRKNYRKACASRKYWARELTDRPHVCPVCGAFVFQAYGRFEICPKCGWEDDGYLEELTRSKNDLNGLPLLAYRKKYCDLLKKDPAYACDPAEYGEYLRVRENHLLRLKEGKDRPWEEIVCPVCGRCRFLAPVDEEQRLAYRHGRLRCSQCGWRYDIDQYHEPDSSIGINSLPSSNIGRNMRRSWLWIRITSIWPRNSMRSDMPACSAASSASSLMS